MVTPSPRAVALGAALALLLFGAGAGHAAITRGLRAPPLDARGALTLTSLRGRMVLLEFFGTACPHCAEAAPRLNALHRRYAAHGLTVFGVTPDAATALADYRRRHGVVHPLAVVPMDTLREYHVPRYPVVLLISPTGRVAFRGPLARLTERVVEAYLARVKILPPAPASQANVVAWLRSGRYGAVERHLEQLRSCTNIDGAACRYVRTVLDWIAWQRTQTFDAAARDLDRGRPYAAWLTYGELAVSYAGTPHGTRAAARRADLFADPRRAREIEARRALTTARRAGRFRSVREAAALLEPVARRHGGTTAGDEAARLLALLRKPP